MFISSSKIARTKFSVSLGVLPGTSLRLNVLRGGGVGGWVIKLLVWKLKNVLVSFAFNVMILNVSSLAEVFSQSNIKCFTCETVVSFN